MKKVLTFALLSIFASPLAAQDSCICLKCLMGFHKSYRMEASSMAPGFDTGACVTMRYLHQDYAALTAGDVIVFRHHANQADWVKRVIGLPGDSVQMIEGVVWLNGQPAEQVQLADYEKIYSESENATRPAMCRNHSEIDGICRIEHVQETLPNGRH